MPEQRYRCFTHRDCEYFPCHQGIDKEKFNCLFCWCPLYALGDKCGGNFVYHENGVKDCSKCAFPHQQDNYDKIVERFQELVKLTQRPDKIVP